MMMKWEHQEATISFRFSCYIFCSKYPLNVAQSDVQSTYNILDIKR